MPTTFKTESRQASEVVITPLKMSLQRQALRASTGPFPPTSRTRELELLLFPDKYRNTSRYAEPDYAYIHRELARSGVTLPLLREEYTLQWQNALPVHPVLREVPPVGQSDQGHHAHPAQARGRHGGGLGRRRNSAVRFGHRRGVCAYLFLAVLPCSYMVYSETREDMRIESWLLCRIHAYNYFGGVTRLLFPDNCKIATISNTRYEVIFNRSYQELAEHNGTAIVPARVRNPRDKSDAEGSVHFAET